MLQRIDFWFISVLRKVRRAQKVEEDWSARVNSPSPPLTNSILQLGQSRPIHREPDRQAAV
jgi:hypothetical protein